MNDSTKETTMNRQTFLAESGLPADLVTKMQTAVDLTSERCPLKRCRAGRGRFCLDIEGIPTYDGIHLARRMFIEADDLERAAYGFGRF